MRELCGNDTKLHNLLSGMLYRDPLAAISAESLDTLVEEAERESITDENYQRAMAKYMLAVEKAVFEASQHQEERGRYIKLIQDLTANTLQAMEKAKEKAVREGLNDRAASLGKRIENDKFMSERIEDVLKVASLYYNERLELHGATERREARGEARRSEELREEREEREEKPEEKRDKKREKERREKRQEDVKEEKLEEEREEKQEEERGEARREKILETRREEDKTSV